MFYQHLVGYLNWNFPKNESFTVTSSLWLRIGPTSFFLVALRRERFHKRLVNCANKTLHGEPDENSKRLRKREALQQFCSGFVSLQEGAPLRTPMNRLPSISSARRLPPCEYFTAKERCMAQHSVLETHRHHAKDALLLSITAHPLL